MISFLRPTIDKHVKDLGKRQYRFANLTTQPAQA
jgi:hypothetical protein